MAISVPAPIAIPVSAEVSAGASFIPSPTIATLPYFLSSLIFSSLPSGKTPAIIPSTPACLPIAAAVFSLSPVSIITPSPIFLSSSTACLLSGLTVSARAMIPSSKPSSEKRTGVLPSAARESIICMFSAEISVNSEIYPKLPARIFPASETASRPFPGISLNSLISTDFIPRDSASFAIAFARGWLLLISTDAAV